MQQGGANALMPLSENEWCTGTAACAAAAMLHLYLGNRLIQNESLMPIESSSKYFRIFLNNSRRMPL
jgi:hypothetical protein